MTSNALTVPPARALAPDLARGLMLLLIATANVSWFLWGRPASDIGAHLLDGTPLDQVVQAIMMVAVDGRAYPLFAFLFGYGMVQFVRSRVARGVEYRGIRRMLRRRHLAMLFVIGLAHGALLFMGDIVGAYGLVGLILVALLFDRSDRTLWVFVWVLIGLHVLMMLFSLAGGFATAAFAPDMTEQPFGAGDAREMTVGTDNYLASIGSRLLMWLSIGLMQGIFSPVPICIVLGWLAARHGVLDDPGRHRRMLTRVALVGIPIGWLGGVPNVLSHFGATDLPAWAFASLGNVTGMVGALGYVALFGLFAARWQQRPSAPVLAIAAVGKRSLTFYLLQSVVFAPLFAAWGFGIGGWIGSAAAIGIAVLVWLVSIPIAALLERRGVRGPAEVLLRRLTYGR